MSEAVIVIKKVKAAETSSSGVGVWMEEKRRQGNMRVKVGRKSLSSEIILIVWKEANENIDLVPKTADCCFLLQTPEPVSE